MMALWIFIIGTLFWLEETAYFGWNMTPQSHAEVICDGIVAIILSLSALAKAK